jgi:hypothetical protein
MEGAETASHDMALDHYVSQVHLKNFYSPALDGLMYAIRKSDLKRFTPKSQDVCRIEEGSTNAYLTEDRAVEEFLKDVEPRYNASLANAGPSQAPPGSDLKSGLARATDAVRSGVMNLSPYDNDNTPTSGRASESSAPSFPATTGGSSTRCVRTQPNLCAP